ncbi:hypothetical protein ABUU53_14335 [Escherichia coli]
MMPKTQEQRNALTSTARRCNEELKAQGIPFTLFTWTIGVMNKQFREY